ncbi:hypothetical protein DI005_25230 [Prauserella sp. PE36]|nr:hypothetical protein DI005_25230 [Prauserella sp. PE36]
MPLKRRTWLWDQRVPLGELTLWVGHAGIGKSQAAVWLAAELSRGRLPGELYGVPSPVLYLGTEDSWSFTLAPRFVASGADLDRVYRLYAETSDGGEAIVSLAVDLDELREEIKGTGARLVVLDALLSTMSGASDLVKQGVVRRYLEPVSRLAQELNIAVVGVAHFRKSAGADPLHMISGSAEFGQVVRSAIGFARDRDADDDSCVLSLIKTNVAPQGLPSIRYRIEPALVDTPEGPTDVGTFVPIGESDTHVRDLLDHEAAPPVDRTERDEAAAWLTDYLVEQGGSAPRKDVFKAGRGAGFSEATLKRAKDKAGVGHESSGFPRTTVWTLDTVGSPVTQPASGDTTEPTEPTGHDLHKQSGSPVQSAQSAQGHSAEPTGPTDNSVPLFPTPAVGDGERLLPDLAETPQQAVVDRLVNSSLRLTVEVARRLVADVYSGRNPPSDPSTAYHRILKQIETRGTA